MSQCGPHQSSQTACECSTEFVCCVSASESAPKKLPWNRWEKWRKVHIACVGLITKRARALAPVHRVSREVGYPNHADGIQWYLIGWTGFEQYFEILKYCSWTASCSILRILNKTMYLMVIYKAHWTPHVSPQKRGRNHSNDKCHDTLHTHILKLCRSWFGLRRVTVGGLAGLGCYSCRAHTRTVSCAWIAQMLNL